MKACAKLSGIYQLHVSREGLLDQVEVHCELQPQVGIINDAERREIAGWVEHRVKTLVGISTRVVVHEPNAVERTQTGKSRRIVNTRPH